MVIGVTGYVGCGKTYNINKMKKSIKDLTSFRFDADKFYKHMFFKSANIRGLVINTMKDLEGYEYEELVKKMYTYNPATFMKISDLIKPELEKRLEIMEKNFDIVFLESCDLFEKMLGDVCDTIVLVKGSTRTSPNYDDIVQTCFKRTNCMYQLFKNFYHFELDEWID